MHTDRAWVPETDFFSLAPFVQGNLKLLDGQAAPGRRRPL